MVCTDNRQDEDSTPEGMSLELDGTTSFQKPFERFGQIGDLSFPSLHVTKFLAVTSHGISMLHLCSFMGSVTHQKMLMLEFASQTMVAMFICR